MILIAVRSLEAWKEKKSEYMYADDLLVDLITLLTFGSFGACCCHEWCYMSR